MTAPSLPGNILDHVGGYAVGIVQGDDLGKRHTLAFRLVGPCDFLDDPGPPFERHCVLFHLPVDDLADDGDILLEFFCADDLHLLFDKIGKGVLHPEFVHHPQRPPDDQPGKVPFPHVRGHDAVAEHIGKAPGMVDNRVHLLDGCYHTVEFFGRDLDSGGHFLPQVKEVGAGDVHEPGKLRVQREDLRIVFVFEQVRDPGRAHDPADHVGENRVVDGRGTF